MRSVLSSNLVNEARIGYSGAPVKFFGELNTEMFSGAKVPQSGYQIVFPTINATLTNPSPNASPSSRNANSIVFEDTLSWLKGSHSITSGVSFTQYDIWAMNSMLVPQLRFGVLTSDPANAMFSAANFPGASAANITAAANLYALLTGRIQQICR